MTTKLLNSLNLGYGGKNGNIFFSNQVHKCENMANGKI